ncbi:hypothetical protein KIN20_004997 [Parelaphostrongylus tenuis]|uniref:poly(ADP-ribose) glycohydrolase n=1 Tax=Parelaphostrongylus tenuis TaxID=148309 RepID=A0AAD5LZC8_PARTN|nr:hypothetical protein KIN20_004997 [Parelaphostrongylus tenuis]
MTRKVVSFRKDQRFVESGLVVREVFFDLGVSEGEVEKAAEGGDVQRQCPSSAASSPATDVLETYPTQSHSSSILDNVESDAIVAPSTSTSDCSRNDRAIEIPSTSNSYSSITLVKDMGDFSSERILQERLETHRNADSLCHDTSEKNVEGNERSPVKTLSERIEEVVLESVQISPSKSRSLSTFLYSPQKMELCNSRRLKTILAKTKNDFEYLPNLGKMSDQDFCAFEVSSLSRDRPPLPSPETCGNTDLNFRNSTEYVRLPWSTANIVSGFHHYIIIDRALRALVHDGAHCIEAVIVTLRECAPWLKSLHGLLNFMDSLSPSEQREVLDVMAGIARLAVNAKFILTSPVPLLRANSCGSVTLSQEQCACLLAHAFFCTYRRERRSFNRINMAGIFDDRNPMCHVKLRFILHYFSTVLKKMPTGCVSFRRESLAENLVPNWEEDQTLMRLMATASDSSIEDSFGCLQVDFANEYIGGGVLNCGAVQEEIRFLICPEMIVSCLLCERMGPLEVVHIVGAQRYSSYDGYAQTLRWAPYNEFGLEPRDEFSRVKCEVVAMDATLFKSNSKQSQYDKRNIDRELNKVIYLNKLLSPLTFV